MIKQFWVNDMTEEREDGWGVPVRRGGKPRREGMGRIVTSLHQGTLALFPGCKRARKPSKA